MAEDRLGAIRQLLQDLIAPEVGRISTTVGFIAQDCTRLGEDIKNNQDEIKEIWKTIGNVKETVARMDGRVENLKEEVVAKLQVQVERWVRSSNPSPSLLPEPTDPEKSKL